MPATKPALTLVPDPPRGGRDNDERTDDELMLLRSRRSAGHVGARASDREQSAKIMRSGRALPCGVALEDLGERRASACTVELRTERRGRRRCTGGSECALVAKSSRT